MLRIEVDTSQAGALKESSQAFSNALAGKIVNLGQRISFHGVLMVVTSLEPASPALVGPETAVKIKLSQEPANAICRHCGQKLKQDDTACPGCGKEINILAL